MKPNSDGRILTLTGLLLLLAGLCVYSGFFHPWISLNDCLKRPDEYDGRKVTCIIEPVIGTIHSDGFTLMQKGVPTARVLADTSGLIEGKYVELAGIFRMPDRLEALKLRVSHGRRLKIWISLIPVILIAGYFIKLFRWNRSGRFWEKRTHA